MSLRSLSRGFLCLQEELRGDRDSIFNFEAQYTQRYQEAGHCRPILDEKLAAQSPQTIKRIIWPENRPFAALLSHDVDGTREHSREQLWRTVRLHVSSENTWTGKIKHLLSVVGLRHRPGNRDLISPWLEAERQRGFSSTFFIFASKVQDRNVRDLTYRWDDLMPFEGRLQSIRSVFSQVAARGWEIGLHGSINSALSPGLTREQRMDVEEAVGKEVVSGRQHNLQFAAAITPELIADGGLKIDCTLGSNRTVFFRTGTSYPHRLWSVPSNRWLDVWEIPLVLHDGALLRKDNLDLSPNAAFRFCRAVIERVAAVRGVVSLLWHPENLLKPGYFELYEQLLDLLHEMGAWATSAKEIIRWWQESGNAELLEEAWNRE